jgi:hypothetical protein
MRRTLSAAVLFLAFCCPISAGVIHSPSPEPTPLSGDAVLSSPESETPLAETDEPGASETLTEMSLDLLTVLPALF